MNSHATPEGTSGFADRHASLGERAFRSLGATGLVVSGVGFGCYRVDDDSPEHAASLEQALRGGCNLIDTSTNYGDGGSERLVGNVLRALAASSEIARQEIVVVSKIGYVQGGNLELAREREREGRPFTDVVKYADGCWHCIHPDFIADQLKRSLARLGLESLDACLLHNPEYYLSDAAHRGRGSLAERRDEFDRRLRAAFARLEDECDAGRIRCYGVSSNTFVRPAGDEEATSLTRMLEIAREVATARGGEPESHRFRVVQLPFNLLESGAVLERNCGARLERTVLEEAAASRLGVLVNRPLNAFGAGTMVRLADFPVRAEGVNVDEAARAVAALEAEFEERIAPALELPGGTPRRLFGWGAELGSNARRFSSVLHWRQVETDMVAPRVAHALAHVPRHLVGRPRLEWAGWQARYEPALATLLAAIGDLHRGGAQAASDALSARLDPSLPAEWRGESLSRKSIAVLLGSPGVSCVLVGMRRPDYVADALGALSRPAPPIPSAAWSRLGK